MKCKIIDNAVLFYQMYNHDHFKKRERERKDKIKKFTMHAHKSSSSKLTLQKHVLKHKICSAQLSQLSEKYVDYVLSVKEKFLNQNIILNTLSYRLFRLANVLP